MQMLLERICVVALNVLPLVFSDSDFAVESHPNFIFVMADDLRHPV